LVGLFPSTTLRSSAKTGRSAVASGACFKERPSEHYPKPPFYQRSDSRYKMALYLNQQLASRREDNPLKPC
jgi:hypothetical protein